MEIFIKGFAVAFVVMVLGCLTCESDDSFFLQFFGVILCFVISLFVLFGLSSCSKKSDSENANIFYTEGMESARKKNYTVAIQKFNKVDELSPYSENAKNSRIMTSYSNYMLGNYEDVIAEVELFEKLHPYDENLSYLLYLKIRSMINNIKWSKRDLKIIEDSITEIQSMSSRFVGTEYYSTLEKELPRLKKAVYNNNLFIAKQYFDNGNCLASLRKFFQVQKTYKDYITPKDEKLISEKVKICTKKLNLGGV